MLKTEPKREMNIYHGLIMYMTHNKAKKIPLPYWGGSAQELFYRERHKFIALRTRFTCKLKRESLKLPCKMGSI